MSVEDSRTQAEFDVSHRGEERLSEFVQAESSQPVLLAQNAAGSPASSDLQPVDAGAATAPADAAAAVATNAKPVVIIPDVDNVAKLPAGTSIENASVEGRDIVLKQPDGSEIVIKNAAVNIPSFIIDQVQIPQEALTAALEAKGINVAAGPNGSLVAISGNLQGSGNNFAQAVPGIGKADPILDLLPPTALRFPELERRELFPFGRRPNRPVNVNGENETVYENDLVNGSSPSPSSLVQPGTINLSTPDGLSTITIGGVTVYSGGALTGTLTIDTPLGLLTVTGFTPTLAGGVVVGGVLTYEYLLQDNSLNHTQAGTDGGVIEILHCCDGQRRVDRDIDHIGRNH